MAKKANGQISIGLVLIGLLVDALGVIMIAAGVIPISFTFNSESTTAQIIDNKESCRIHNNDFSRGEEICSYSAIFEYTVNGERYTTQSAFSDTPALYQVGETVAIRYDPQDHARAELESKMSIAQNPLLLVFIISGSFLTMLGMAILIGGLKPRNPKKKAA